MRKGNILDSGILLWICPGLVYMIGAVSLHIDQGLHDHCSGSLSLGCSAQASGTPIHIFMSWVSQMKEVLCNMTDGVIYHQANGTLCQYDGEKLTLTVTLLGARAWSRETYYCKLRSNLGISNANTPLQPPAVCEGSFQHTALQSPPREECFFYDVYPEGQVHWFSDGKNLTASSKILRGDNGLFNISSVLPRQENMSDLICRLSSQKSSYAIPYREEPKVAPSHEIKPSSSSSGGVGLHWALFLTGLLLLSQWE
ncbi:uncharacterized protein LOC121705965 [Alosa sapidissima]|uniref:uncharacterized protein LOC121705965 n=1 Tax=Alosa sapidissima TaxID=34773 RepID=UPI001C0955B9|nr:uncharacterized protein LOC121705965 [Alosa sapidissima]XP_041943310.1 uncharacterized protein LOC121705965 [Alosa sapidissima]XP_041943311.1 uncharacterized protein LOC121705965 [Alosa sapidissima]